MADYDAEDLGLLAREVVLPHRDAEYVSRLLEKLLSQEVFGALDLVKVSSDLLEQKLENSNKFDILYPFIFIKNQYYHNLNT